MTGECIKTFLVENGCQIHQMIWIGETTKMRGVWSTDVDATRNKENWRILKRVDFNQARTKPSTTYYCIDYSPNDKHVGLT